MSDLPDDFKVFRPPATGPDTRNPFIGPYTTPTKPFQAAQSLPDSYFAVTAADVRDSQAVLTARSKALNDAPLVTKGIRDAKEKERLARWPTTTIRIKFTDRTILEKKFPSTDKMRSIYAFVRNSLREDVKPIKFVLYQPPRRELKVSDPAIKEQSLAQLQLAPNSVLLLSFLDDSLNGPEHPAPLAESVLARAEDLPKPPQEVVSNESDSKGKGKAPQTLGGGPVPPDTEKKFPKWFKIGKK